MVCKFWNKSSFEYIHCQHWLSTKLDHHKNRSNEWDQSIKSGSIPFFSWKTVILRFKTALAGTGLISPSGLLHMNLQRLVFWNSYGCLQFLSENRWYWRDFTWTIIPILLYLCVTSVFDLLVIFSCGNSTGLLHRSFRSKCSVERALRLCPGQATNPLATQATP